MAVASSSFIASFLKWSCVYSSSSYRSLFINTCRWPLPFSLLLSLSKVVYIHFLPICFFSLIHAGGLFLLPLSCVSVLCLFSDFLVLWGWGFLDSWQPNLESPGEIILLDRRFVFLWKGNGGGAAPILFQPSPCRVDGGQNIYFSQAAGCIIGHRRVIPSWNHRLPDDI